MQPMITQTNNVRRMSWGWKLCLASFVVGSLPAWSAAVAQDATPSNSETSASSIAPTALPANDQLVLEPGRARKITFEKRIKRANILATDIADVVPLDANTLLITPKKAGKTQLITWDENDTAQVMDIEVQTNLVELRERLAQLFPGSDIHADETVGVITLHGQVHDLQTAKDVEQIAQALYGKEKVINLLEIGGGQQVMLKVRFAEVDKQAEYQLGFNFGGTDGVSSWVGGMGVNPLGLTTGATSAASPGVSFPAGALTAAGMAGAGSFGATAFTYFINAMEQNSVMRMLAEPNLTAVSGQDAKFLAGGSIPYPVAQSSGGGTVITIQWQDYGVSLDFCPVVLGNGRIRIKVAPEVSQLDYAHSITLDGFAIPALTKRNVNTTVELSEGQTFMIGGLLQNQVTASNSQFPVLGDLPILGALFRDVSYQRNETELVVMVTPELVNAMNPGEVPQLPGERWRDPSPYDLYMHKDLGGEEVPSARPPGTPAPRFAGSYGFQPVAISAATSK